MEGRPQDVEGQCNAWLELHADYGHDPCTFRCQLPAGHEGRHEERSRSEGEEWPAPAGRNVATSWEGDDRPRIEDEARRKALEDSSMDFLISSHQVPLYEAAAFLATIEDEDDYPQAEKPTPLPPDPPFQRDHEDDDWGKIFLGFYGSRQVYDLWFEAGCRWHEAGRPVKFDWPSAEARRLREQG